MEPQVTLTITMDASGNVGVSGPVDQIILCYGLLEIARQSIAENHAQAVKAGGLQVVRGQLPNGGGPAKFGGV